jgi:Holin of 3TMs, for gene-transfer release
MANDFLDSTDTNTVNLVANTVTIEDDTPPPPKNTTLKTTVVKSNISTNGLPENWFTSSWRPLAAYMYLFICFFDFFLAPIGMPFIYMFTHTAFIAWVPLTTQGGSIFHLSFGAILGISAYGRTREKLAYSGDDDHDTPPLSPRTG